MRRVSCSQHGRVSTGHSRVVVDRRLLVAGLDGKALALSGEFVVQFVVRVPLVVTAAER